MINFTCELLSSPLSQLPVALMAGFVIFMPDGRFWLTPSGEQYLAQLEKQRDEA